MKKISLLVISLITMASCQQTQKIGFVDNSKLINEYQEKIDVEAKYKTMIEASNKNTDSLAKAFQAEYQEFQAQAASMPQDKAQARYQQLGQKQQMLQQQIQMSEQQITVESQKEIDSLISKVRKFVKDYGKTNAYDYILGSNDAGSVMYGKEGDDLTDELIKALNDSYKK
ncbi:OmpH family outer membrane protein [Formosa sediminum]|uniref:OmpH family outer membrane protein n=1 Tax=Formosa sediminum TaxID=2594004 RepID=A0A516GNX0_9FLAO|nr:OmpH family outer membrane protein [Formosa sediminum]QDO93205.1 OmpH family outer membrane protein [Formosa sediminum]